MNGSHRPDGGIGRRARLKLVFRKECGFDSHSGYKKAADFSGLFFGLCFRSVQDDERADDAGNPAGEREDGDDDDGTAAAIQHGKRGKQDGKEDATNGHARM